LKSSRNAGRSGKISKRIHGAATDDQEEKEKEKQNYADTEDYQEADRICRLGDGSNCLSLFLLSLFAFCHVRR
jgi:hypothetical protein